jgi:hypothetical protein
MEVAALTAFLAPFLPYLLQAGRTFAEEAAHDLGAGAWEHAKALWAKLAPKVSESPAAREAADDMASRPGDDRAKGALELQLEKLLAADPSLADEVARLWSQAKSAGVVAAADRGIAVGGDASGVFVTGDQNTIGR